MAKIDTKTEPTNFPADALDLTTMKFPKAEEQHLESTLILDLFSVGQRIAPWGTGYKIRDRQLRDFWPTEPYLAGSIFSVAIRNANYEWEIKGPDEKVVNALTDMLNGSITNMNFGWQEFMKATTQEQLSQDNGFFWELIRDPGIDVASRFKDENAPVIGLAHLDSNRCSRTGNPEIPVIYTDREERPHKMKWWEIVPMADFSSPIQKMNGIGWSAVSRILKMAQIIHSVETYTDEKISGRHFKQIHFVSGVSRMEIEDIKKTDEEHANNEGLSRYIQPAIYASLDPEKPITTASIDLAALPDNFDFDELMRWYIANIALNVGGDYQDLAPLPSGNIGSASQSEMLSRKSQGKGPANFMEMVENLMRDYGIIPRPYEFKFKVKDLAQESDEAEMKAKIIEGLVMLRRADGINGKTLRAALKKLEVLDENILDLTPEDFGNESSLNKTENMLGQVGDSTIGEDARRTEKNLIGRIVDAVRGDG